MRCECYTVVRLSKTQATIANIDIGNNEEPGTPKMQANDANTDIGNNEEAGTSKKQRIAP